MMGAARKHPVMRYASPSTSSSPGVSGLDSMELRHVHDLDDSVVRW